MRRTLRTLGLAAAVVVAGCAETARQPQDIATAAREELPAAARAEKAALPGTPQADDAMAAFAAYRHARTDADRRRWICIAANRDLHRAQIEVARLHWWSPGDPPTPFAQDGFRYCVWSVIAAHRREPLDDLEKQLKVFFPKIEQWRVRNLAFAWTPDPRKCEDMENSEYFSIPRDDRPAQAREDVLAAARAGDANAAYLAYRQATTDAERRKWICLAANRGHTEAQAEIGRLHARSAADPPGPFAPDLRKAYIWSVIAVYKRLPLDDVERRLGWMVTENKWRATAMAISWKPDPAACENMKNSDYFKIP